MMLRLNASQSMAKLFTLRLTLTRRAISTSNLIECQEVRLLFRVSMAGFLEEGRSVLSQWLMLFTAVYFPGRGRFEVCFKRCNTGEAKAGSKGMKKDM